MNRNVKNERYSKTKKALQPMVQAKKSTISWIARIGRKYRVLKYPIFLVAVLFIFVYNLLMHTFIALRVREELARGLAVVLTIVLTFTSIDFTVFAFADSKGNEYESAIVVGIEELDESILLQKLDLGSTIEDIVLPESISATVTYEDASLLEGELENEAGDELENEVIDELEDESEKVENREDNSQENTNLDEEDAESESEGGHLDETTEGPIISEDSEEIDVPEDTPESNGDASESIEVGDETAFVSAIGSLVDVFRPLNVYAAEEMLLADDIAEATETVDDIAKATETEDETIYLVWKLDSERSTKDEVAFDVPGEYIYTAELADSTLSLAESVVLPEIKVIIGGENKILKTVVGNIEIILEAMPGVFPAGASISATQIESTDILEQIEKLMESELGIADEVVPEQDTIKETVAFDIVVLDKSGNEIQPVIPDGYTSAEAITLTFKHIVSEITDGEGLNEAIGESIQAFHVDDSIDSVETVDADKTGTDVAIHPEHFSIYGFVLTGSTPAVTLGNNGYPYGKNMSTSSITLVIEVESGDAVSYQWQSSSDNSTWVDMDGATSESIQFAPTNGTWYRCKVNGVASREIKVVSPGQDGRSWTKPLSSYYITNGYMAYMSSGNKFDVTGLYEKNGTSYMLQTSFGASGWAMYSSSNPQPSPVGYSGASSALLDKLSITFDPENNFDVILSADLQDGQQAFSFGCDTQLGNDRTSGNYYDSAALIAALNNDKSLFQVAMIGAASEEAAVDTDPAFVIAPVTGNPLYWLSSYGSRQAYGYCTYTGWGYTNTNINGTDVVTAVEGLDSGMTMSWLNVESGGTVSFRFGVGSVADTGAKKASYNATSKKIIVPESDEQCYYAIFQISENGEAVVIKDWIKGNGGDLVFEDLSQNTQYVIKVVSETDYNNGNFGNTEDTEASTAIDPLHPEDTNEYKDQLMDPKFTILSKSITVENVQTGGYSYNLLDTSGNNVFADFIYPDSDGTVVFNNLTPGTKYFFIAKTADNQNSDQVEKKTLPAVTFDLNGKGPTYKTLFDIPVDVSDSENPVGSKIPAPVSPGSSGYQFAGWYKTSACTDGTMWDFENDTITENTTLYAKWIQHEYNWEFQQIDAHTVIATCKHTDPIEGEVICSDHINPAKVELTTTNASYTGDVYAGSNLLNTLSAVDSSNNVSAITYFTDVDCNDPTSTTDSGASVSGGAPRNCGIYYAQVVVKDKNNDVQGVLKASFSIGVKNISSSNLTISPDTYRTNGAEVTANYVVKDGARTLVKDVDYTLDASSVTSTSSVGTFTIKVNGIGNYAGSASKTWKVTDATPPAGKVSVEGLPDSTSLVNSPNFARYFNSDRTVTIEGTDAETATEDLNIGYLVSSHAIAEDNLNRYADSKWTTIGSGNSFTVSHDGPAIVYVKIVDQSGNEKYISSVAFTIDTVAPTIYGITENTSYCNDANFRVADSGSGIASVKIDGVEKYQNGVVDYKLIGSESEPTHTVIVTDKAGNETSVSGIHLKVEELHQWKEVGVSTEPTCTTAGEKEHVCSVCGATKFTYLPKLGHTYDYNDDSTWDMVWELDKDENNETHYYGTAYIRCARGCGHTKQVGDRTVATKVINTEPSVNSEGKATYSISVTYRDANGDLHTKDDLSKETVLGKLSSQDLFGSNSLSTGVNVAQGAPKVSVEGLSTGTAKETLEYAEKTELDSPDPLSIIKTDIYVYLDIQNVTGSVSSSEVDDLTDSLEAALGETVEENKISIIDISMYKNVKKTLVASNTEVSDTVNSITEYSEELTINIKESDLGFQPIESGNERVYIVSRGHDYGSGLTAEVIYEGPAVNGYIPITTKLLCPFAITYRDQPNSAGPGGSGTNPGSNSPDKPAGGDDNVESLIPGPNVVNNNLPNEYWSSLFADKNSANKLADITETIENTDTEIVIGSDSKEKKSKKKSNNKVGNGLINNWLYGDVEQELNQEQAETNSESLFDGATDTVADDNQKNDGTKTTEDVQANDTGAINNEDVNNDVIDKCSIHWLYLVILVVYALMQLLIGRRNKKYAIGILAADAIAGGLLLIPGFCALDYIVYGIELLIADVLYVSIPKINSLLPKDEETDYDVHPTIADYVVFSLAAVLSVVLIIVGTVIFARNKIDVDRAVLLQEAEAPAVEMISVTENASAETDVELAETETAENEVVDSAVEETEESEVADPAVEETEESGVADSVVEETEAVETASEEFDENETEIIQIEVCSGEYSDTVARKLAEAGIVSDAREFDRFLCANGYDCHIKVGSFEFSQGMTDVEVATTLVN